MDERTRALERLRDRGLPQSEMYIKNELARMALEAQRRNARRGVGAYPQGARMPRAEPDQVVSTAARDEKGRIAGRYAGAVATTMAPKEVFSQKQGAAVTKPTLPGSTWQLDLIDAKNMGAEAGFAMVGVDVATRKVYGRLMNGKTLDDITEAFDHIIGAHANPARAHLDVNVPSQLDMDKERGWKNPAFLAHLQKYGIKARFKQDKYAPNSLAMVDNAIKRSKEYIRKRITEEGEDAESWQKYFDESLQAANNRKHEVLSRMAPNELFADNGAPKSENAEHTIFNLEQEQASKLKKNKEKHERMKQTLQKEGAFRIPVDLHLNQRRVLQASHSDEVHGVENFEGTRVVSARDHKAYPMNSVEPVNRASLSVRLPPRLQRPGKMGQGEQRQILEEYVDVAKAFLRGEAEQSAPIESFDAELRKAPGYAEALLRVGFRNAPSDPFRATSKFVKLFGDFTEVRKIVYLEANPSTDEDRPSRPTIEERAAQLERDYDEVQRFPEFREGTFLQRELRRQRLRRAEEEVRAYPEF